MISYWEKDSFIENDFSIVGGGILGLFTALELNKKFPGHRIAIFERGILPMGASTKNAGFACFGSLTEIKKNFSELGESLTLEIIEKRYKGIEKIKSTVDKDAIDYLEYGGHELFFDKTDINDDLNDVNSSLEPIFKRNVFQSAKNKIVEFGFSQDHVHQLLFNPYEGQLHSGKLIHYLIQRCSLEGIRYFTGAEVTSHSDTTRVEFTVNNKLNFKTNHLIFTTNAFPPIDNSVKPGRGQVLITKPIANNKIKGTFHFDEGYYYFRNVGDRILFGGGRNLDYETETSTEFNINTKIQKELIHKLETELLPNSFFEIEMQWSGIMAFSESSLPSIEKISNNVIYAMNCNGMGVSLSPITAEEIASRY